jgi:DNA-binding CsgD family transcriptional regulator
VRFTVEQVARLIALARSSPHGRSGKARIDEFLDRLQPLLPHESSNAVTVDPRTGVVTPEHVRVLTMEELANYAAHYRFVDPMGHCLDTVINRAVALSDFASPTKIGRSEFSDLLDRQNIRHIVGITVPLADGRLFALAMHRHRGQPDFTTRERALLELAVPMLADAFEGDALDPTRVLAELTPRELQVANLAARGLGDREIAQRLGIGFATVRTHLQRAFAKLKVSNRTELAVAMNGRGP